MAKPKRSPKKSARRRAKGRAGVVWAWILGSALVLALAGVGLLSWARSAPGRAALLRHGAEGQFAAVRDAVDAALPAALPGFAPGPAAADTAAVEADPLRHDWPLPEVGPDAAVYCRALALPAGTTLWEGAAAVAEAVAATGAEPLWGERLVRPAARWSRGKPPRELLRLDLGVAGRATHTLLLYPEDDGPPAARWGDGAPRQSASDLLGGPDAPTIALIIDDWGNFENETTRELLALDVPLTLSVLPGLPFSRRFALCATELAVPVDERVPTTVAADPAAWARRERLSRGCPVRLSLGEARPRRLPSRRREVFLHLPMEPEDYAHDPGEPLLRIGMGRDTIEGLVDGALRGLPNVTGVNNHMGSGATADRETMDRLMKVLRERGLHFVDSVTSSRSVAADAARDAGIPTLENRIFLDQPITVEAVRRNLAQLVRSARAVGHAVGIGHPHPQTLAALREELPRYRDEGVRFVTVSELMALRAEAADRIAAR